MDAIVRLTTNEDLSASFSNSLWNNFTFVVSFVKNCYGFISCVGSLFYVCRIVYFCTLSTELSCFMYNPILFDHH